LKGLKRVISEKGLHAAAGSDLQWSLLCATPLREVIFYLNLDMRVLSVLDYAKLKNKHTECGHVGLFLT
jgi:hypothetical protein